MKSLLSFYHLFKVRNWLDKVTIEVCELFYKPGMKEPEDFSYDVAQGTLVKPAELYGKLETLDINGVIPHSGMKWEMKLPVRRYR